jgi:phosphohistidine phosphatase
LTDANTGEPLDQACTVPYRRTPEGVEICLITTMKGRWGLPKGIVDPGETLVSTALKESHEEAGITGEIIEPALGRYDDFKWNRPLHVTVFLMHVTDVADEWLESSVRQRQWVSPKEARKRLADTKQAPFLEKALERLK